MPREPRVYIENALYYVTARVDRDRVLFHDQDDHAEYLKPLSEAKLLNGFKIFAYALMPGCISLLVELRNNVHISTIMHNLNSRYTKTYNSRYGKKGHLFQGRFKSIIIEKENHLLRMTRYIHTLPYYSGAAKKNEPYPYSSCGAYLNAEKEILNVLDKPDMEEEIKEVMACLDQGKTFEDQKRAYAGYVSQAWESEMKAVGKLLHRKAFVGSRAFLELMEAKTKEHVIDKQKARIVRKPNRVFILTGSSVILFLGIVAYNFYNSQSSLQNALNTTASGFEAAREDLVKRVSALQNEITGFEAKENHGLGDLAWELRLTPVRQEYADSSYTDKLEFKGGQVVSKVFLAKGFLPFDYSIQDQTHGKKIWQTTQTNTDGLTVRWYGIIAGDTMRGVLSEVPGQGETRDFSFVSVKRIRDIGGQDHVVQ